MAGGRNKCERRGAAGKGRRVLATTYANGAVLALALLAYAAVAGRVERSWISGPMVFLAAGFVAGPDVLGLLRLQMEANDLRLLAEATLAMVLFSDAAQADWGVIRVSAGLPRRLLLVGLPLTMLLGLGTVWLLFPNLQVPELALLATMLAPTDAALGKPVLTDRGVPAVLREALNFESGLNDGICVPVIVILLSLAVGIQIEGGTLTHVLSVVVEEIGVGALTGLLLSAGGRLLLRHSAARGWMDQAWSGVAMPALAAACFAVAQTLHGSGFIACFVGGLWFGYARRGAGHGALLGLESTGDALSLVTWLAFGAVAVDWALTHAGVGVIAYAVLSLTVIRMLPVAVCMLGARRPWREVLFLGWFGPRGLASIVFGIMVLDAKLPGNATLAGVMVWTVLLSVVAHGLTARPFARGLNGPGAHARGCVGSG